jgi:hypothetical protein
METSVVKPGPADPEDKLALLRDVLTYWMSVRWPVSLLGVVVTTLAQGFWWFALYPRLQSLYTFMAEVAYDDLSWNQRLMIRAPWVFELCSVLLVLAVLVTTVLLSGRARSRAMLVLFVMSVAELVCLVHSTVFAYIGLNGVIR